MLVPCEVAVKCVLPAVRALLSKQLTEKHDLTQVQVAKLLGLSQPAISLYASKLRGQKLKVEGDAQIGELVGSLASSLAEGRFSHKDFIPKFCEICKTIRAKGLLCRMHKAFDPSINTEECELCSTLSQAGCL